MSENKAVLTDIPFALGLGVPDALSRYERSTFAAHYAIGNMPWLSAANINSPISRVTTPYQKERIDQGSSAGENSLSNWWLRSATSWHRGAGLTFYDAAVDDLYRFDESANVDVWTPGQISLLPDTVFTAETAPHHPATCDAGTWLIIDGAVYLYATAGTLTAVSGITGTAQVLTSDGSSAIVGTSTGVWQVTSALVATKLYNQPTGSASWTVNSIAFVKNRIVLAAEITDTNPMHVFELGRNPSSTTTVVIASDSRYSTKNVSYPTITATTGAILVGSTTGVISQVLSFTIDMTAGGIGMMNEATVVAEFPRGETLNQLRSYLNTYVVAATSKGLRIGVENAAGDGFTYGQRMFDAPVTDLAFTGEFVYATRADIMLGTAGLWRVDLGTLVGDAFAYASDLSTADTQPNGVAFIGSTGRKLITDSNGLWVESTTDYAESGYVRSGWIRFGTTEKKQPVSFMLRTGDAVGTVGFTIEDSAGSSTGIDFLPVGGTQNIAVSASLLADGQHQIQINMGRTTATESPTLEEWQLRSLPAPVRSRTITLPLRCYDEESDSNGVTVSSDPWARFHRLEALEQSGSAVLFQDFTTGEERVCQIRGVQFEQSTVPSFAHGFGGTVTVQLQTMDVES